ncbi:hypothetical protein M422DRAFT_52210 [Sphaerobolus stellatus SS14]|uniref:Uncharacterized protein n=1 Tax=Sphaerobolus stellatus (strain SS14) TaxID=990650 RepID=A0A0C9UXJ5_SPHS4|nr:hypothetical protein M422DRAFT_52210 [Sphaerobolus stellatus SS14]
MGCIRPSLELQKVGDEVSSNSELSNTFKRYSSLVMLENVELIHGHTFSFYYIFAEKLYYDVYPRLLTFYGTATLNTLGRLVMCLKAILSLVQMPRYLYMVHPAVDYATQFALAKPWQGYALWQPDHRRSVCPSIGSVGYLLNGAWVEVANIKDKAHEFGTFQHDILHRDRSIFSANVKILKTGFRDGSECVPGGGALIRSDFQCTQGKGSLLVLSDDVDQCDVIKRQYFKNYLTANYKTWFHSAEEDNDELSLGDIILVTGHDKTSGWMNAVFQGGFSEFSLDISFGVPMLKGAAATVEFSTSQLSQVQRNWGPISDFSSVSGAARSLLAAQETISTQSPLSCETLHLIRDQCIFLRGCKILDRYSCKKLFNFKKMKEIFTEVDSDPSDQHHGHSPSSSCSYSSSNSSSNLSSFSFNGGRIRACSSPFEKSTSSYKQQDVDSNSTEELGDSVKDSSECDSDSSDSSLNSEDHMYSEKIQDPLLLLLAYMLENSDAELAVADHSDLAALNIGDLTSAAEFIRALEAINPPILIEGQVGQLCSIALKDNPLVECHLTALEVPLDNTDPPTYEEDPRIKLSHELDWFHRNAKESWSDTKSSWSAAKAPSSDIDIGIH